MIMADTSQSKLLTSIGYMHFLTENWLPHDKLNYMESNLNSSLDCQELILVVSPIVINLSSILD